MVTGHENKALYYQEIMNICAILDLKHSDIQILSSDFKIKHDKK